MDVWGLASALSDAVKKTGQDLVETVRNTEWKNEFADIRKELEEETSEITNNAKTLTEKLNDGTAKVIEKTGLKGTVGLLRHEDEEQGSSNKKVWISDEADAKVQEFGRRVFKSTGQTYDTIAKAFKNELGLGNNQNHSGDRGTHGRSRLESSRLYTLETDQQTFTRDPDDRLAFDTWKEESHNVPAPKVLSALLEESEHLKKMYTLLVPEKVSHDEFWNRYFFKLQSIEKHHQLLVKAAMRSSNDESNEVGWDDTWEGQDDGDNIQIGEEIRQTVDDSEGKTTTTDSESLLEKNKEGSPLAQDVDSKSETHCTKPLTSPNQLLQTECQDQELENDPPVEEGLHVSNDDSRSESSIDDVTNWE